MPKGKSIAVWTQNGQFILSEFKDKTTLMHISTPENTASFWINDEDLKEIKEEINRYLNEGK